MKKFTAKEKINGELAARNLSDKAYNFYVNTDPLTVYEYGTENGTRYAYNSCDSVVSDLTFAELQNELEELQESFLDSIEYLNTTTGETWTREEIETNFENFRDEINFSGTFQEYLENLVEKGELEKL